MFHYKTYKVCMFQKCLKFAICRKSPKKQQPAVTSKMINKN